MHLAMFLSVERARPSSAMALATYSCLAALALAASFASQPAFVAIFTVVVVGESLAPFAGVVLSAARVPLHVEHVAERIGLIMMVTLGECVGVVLLQAVTYKATQYVGGRWAGCWCCVLVGCGAGARLPRGGRLARRRLRGSTDRSRAAAAGGPGAWSRGGVVPAPALLPHPP
jgi:hypothetical protein